MAAILSEADTASTWGFYRLRGSTDATMIAVAKRLTRPMTVGTRAGGAVEWQPGDYLASTPSGALYMVRGRVFEACFEPLPDNALAHQ